jgi:MFS family permease
LAYAEHHSSVLGFFIRPFESEFGWSRTAISAVQSIARVVEAVIAPFIGPLVDRHGPRLLMPIGALIVGFAMIAATQVEAIWQFYLLRGVVVALGFTLMGSLVTNVAIMNWFVRKRGRAVAIAGIGTNLGNIILTPVTVWVIAVYDWRASFVLFGVLTWLLVLLPSLILMRRRPEDMGLRPDGDSAPPERPAAAETGIGAPVTATPAREPVWSRREVLATASFWFLIVSFAFANLSFQGINISLAPYMQDLGYGDAFVTGVVVFRSTVMALMLLPWGPIGERAVASFWVRIAPFALQGMASFFFLLGDEPVFLLLAVTVYAFGFAGILVVQEVVWAGYFGRLSLGLVRSTAWPAAFGFSAIGPVFMNLIFDVTGSYQLAYTLFIGFYALACLFMWLCRPPTPRRYADVTDLAPASPRRGH